MAVVKMILTNAFHPDVRVYKEAKYLVEKGHDVEILCWDRKSEYISRSIEEVEGIKIKRFYPQSLPGTGFRQLKPFFAFIRECKNYLKDKHFYYLHCHDLDGIIAGHFAKHNKPKIVFDMHEFYEVNGSKQKYRYLVRAIVQVFQNKSDSIICVNNAQAAPLTIKNRKKLVFIPNYPVASHYQGCEKTNSDKLRVAYIGSVRQFKQLKNLMDACAGLKDVHVYIHGAGVHADKLKSIEKNYTNVSVTGKYDYGDSPKLYSECDLLYAVYPVQNFQNRIGEPIKFYEAIITKTPIVVDRRMAIGNFIEEKSIGFTVDGDKVDEISSLIERIIDNKSILAEQEKNLEKIQYDYSWEEVVKNLEKIYSVHF